MKKLLFLALMAVLLPLAAMAAKSEEDMYLNAMDYYNKQDFPKATAGFQEFLKEYPQSKYKPGAMMKQAELEENFILKKELYEKIIEQYAGTEYEPEATYSLGRLFHASGDNKKAQEYLGTVIGKFSNTVWIEPAYYYMMLSLESMTRFDEAKAIYKEYNSGKGYYMYKNRIELAYGNILFRTGELAKAAESYEKVIDKYDDNEKYIYIPPVYKKLAETYDKLNLPEKSKDIMMAYNKKFPEADVDGNTQNNAAKMSADAVATVPPQDAAEPAAVTGTAKEQAAAVSGGTKQEQADSPAGSFFAVQVGAFSNAKYIKAEKDKYAKLGIPVTVKKSGPGKLSKVMVGKFNSKEEAQKFAMDQKIKKFFVTEIKEDK